MFEYKVKPNQKLEIKTPGIENFDDIKKDVFMTDGLIVNRSTYPNGLEIEIEQHSEFVVIRSNRELTNIEDGLFIAPEC